MIICQNCGFDANGVYCSQCGQPLTAKRITVHHMLHEVAHTFWHLEKGFLYTLKELAIHPGTMQRKYLSGFRLNFQKPFPLYAISISFFALALYLIYLHAPNQSYQDFYKHYFFLVQTSMLPFYALITYLLFYNTHLNYAEALVMNVYMLGFTSVIIVPINLLSYIFPNIVISAIEILFLVTYNMFTYVNFFKEKKAWWVIVKSILSIVAGYLLFQVISNLVMEWFMH
jgi:hypothetical protein